MATRSLLLASAFVSAAYGAASATGAFNVLSFNVAGLPAILQDNDETGDKTTNTEIIGTTFAKYRDAFDVIHVQEDFNYHATLYEYDDHPYRTATSGGAGIGDGLNTLSNYDWIDFERDKWNQCSGVVDDGNDCLTPKGFTFMRVRLDEGVYVDFYNLHADAGDADADEVARDANIQQVVDFIAANSIGNPVLVYGDTNSRYTRVADNIAIFTNESGLTDAWVQLERGGVPPAAGSAALVCDNPSPNNTCETVDKVLYRGNKIMTLNATQFDYIGDLFLQPDGDVVSDHNPVLVNFTYSLSNTLRQSDFFGGPHGTWFTDLPSLPTSPRLASITMRGAARLDAISFTLTNGATYTHGGTGGTAYSLTLKSGEYISSAYMCEGQKSGETRIFYVKLTTSLGNTLTAGTSTSDCITVSAPASNWGIVAALGRDGDEVDRLGFIFANYGS